MCCEKEFNKMPSEIKKTANNFCSRSCAAKINNKKHPKREKKKMCKGCLLQIYAGNTWCKECFVEKEEKRFLSNKTKGEMSLKTGYPSNKYRQIRNNAMIVAKNHNLLKKPCKCGYSKHVEICHIKPISTFSDETLVSEINDISNLVQMCPNCHWEFDNNV